MVEEFVVSSSVASKVTSYIVFFFLCNHSIETNTGVTAEEKKHLKTNHFNATRGCWLSLRSFTFCQRVARGVAPSTVAGLCL